MSTLDEPARQHDADGPGTAESPARGGRRHRARVEQRYSGDGQVDWVPTDGAASRTLVPPNGSSSRQQSADSQGPRRISPVRRARVHPAVLAVLVVVVCCAAAAAWGQSRPVLYAAHADIVLAPDTSFSDTMVERILVTERVLLTSPTVLEPVARSLGTGTEDVRSRVSTTIPQQDSLVLRVVAVAGTREGATDLAGRVVRQYEPVATQYGEAPVGRRLMGPYPVPGRHQPQPTRDLALGLFVGLLLAAGLVLLQGLLRGRREGRRGEASPPDTAR